MKTSQAYKEVNTEKSCFHPIQAFPTLVNAINLEIQSNQNIYFHFSSLFLKRWHTICTILCLAF